MVATKKTIKKKFMPMNIPLINKEIEVYGVNIESFDNRFIKLDLTSDLKGRAIELKLKVKVTESKAEANPVELQLMGFYIRRMMRKGVDYVEDSFVAKCKDNNLRIKPFLITRKRVSNKVLAGLRTLTKSEITNYIQDKNFDYVVVGEGKNTLLEWLEKFEMGQNDFSQVEGLVFRKNNEIIINPKSITGSIKLVGSIQDAATSPEYTRNIVLNQLLNRASFVLSISSPIFGSMNVCFLPLIFDELLS